MQEIRVVLDANIWVSYFIKSKIHELTELLTGKNIVICRSDESVRELKDVLSRKKFGKYLKEPVDFYIHTYRSFIVFFETESIFTACPDEKDNYLFDLTYQSSALYLVSGDKKVLSTPVKPPLQVITLADLKKIFS